MNKRQTFRRILILISFLLFPITIFYLSPVIIFEGLAVSEIAADFIVFSLLFIFALIFGRLFCGWLCPGGGLQETARDIKNKPISQKYNWIKFLIWTPWFLLIVYMVIIKSPLKLGLLRMTNQGLSIYDPYTYFIYFAVLGLILIPAFIIGNRSFCHHICWMAPFMIIGRKISNFLKIPRLKLVSDKKGCTNCMNCNRNCSMSLDVNKMVKEGKMENSECILCAECIDNCPNKVIKYKFGS